MLLQAKVIALFDWTNNLRNYEEVFFNSLNDKDVSVLGTDEENKKLRTSFQRISEALEVKRRNVLKLSVLTSWITPFTVLKNTNLDRLFKKTVLSTRYFLTSNLSMHAVTLLAVAGVLFDKQHLVKHCNLLEDATNSSTCILHNATFNSDSHCANNSTFLCEAFRTQESKVAFVFLILTVYLVAGLSLQFFGNYCNLFRPFNRLSASTYFAHFTVLRDGLIDSQEEESSLKKLVAKGSKNLLRRQDILSGETCLHVAIRHGLCDLAHLMIQRGAVPTVRNFNQENIDSWWQAQKRVAQSAITWKISIKHAAGDSTLEYSKGRLSFQYQDVFVKTKMPIYQVQAAYFKILVSTLRSSKPLSRMDVNKILENLSEMDEAIHQKLSDFPNLLGEKTRKRFWFQNFCQQLVDKEMVKTLSNCLGLGLQIRKDTERRQLNQTLKQLESTVINKIILYINWKYYCKENSKEPISYLQYLAIIGNANVLRENVGKNSKSVQKDPKFVLLAAENGNFEVLEFLLEIECDLEGEFEDGMTAWHLCAKNGHETCLKLLIENDSNDQGVKLCSALHYAAQGGHDGCVELLIENGASVNVQRTYDGGSALQIAAQNGHTKCLQLLIENGANIDALSFKNWTALHLAAQNGHDESLQLLIEKGANKEVKETSAGVTPLHISAQNGNDKCLQLLLESGANKEAQYGEGFTALHWTAQNGYYQCMKILIEMEANVEVGESSGGGTAVHLATFYGNVECLELLLEKGAKIEALTNLNWTPLMIAVQNGYYKCLQLLIEKGANPDAKDKFDEASALLIAAQNGDDKCLQRLLENRAKIETYTSKRSTPIHLAAQNGHEKCLGLLMGSGCASMLDDQECSYGATALHFAARNGHFKCLQMLIESGASIDLKTHLGYTALHLAALEGHRDCLQLLFDKGANKEDLTNEGWTALHLAAGKGHKKCAQLLIEMGVEIESKNTAEWSALHQAARHGHFKCMKLLLKKGANCEAQNNQKWTALHLAAEYGHYMCLQLLIDKVANIDIQVGSDGGTALHFAAQNGHDRCVQLLLEKGANIEALNRDQCSPLHNAVAMGREKCVDVLMRKGANTDAKQGSSGATALHVAAGNGFDKCLALLMEKSDDIDCQTNQGSTPLHFAAQYGRINCLQMLIEKGANIEACTNQLWTAVHLAAYGGQHESVQLLIEKGANLEATTSTGETALQIAAELRNEKCVELLAKKEVDTEPHHDSRHESMDNAKNATHIAL